MSGDRPENEFVRTGQRLCSPSFERNHRPLIDVLATVLGTAGGDVLEIGSGTGQHATCFAQNFPQYRWWPTDPDTEHLVSIAAWTEHLNTGNVAAPQHLDATQDPWPLGEAGYAPASGLDTIFCMNVVHISPWSVTLGLMRGAGAHLRHGGHLILYGPFARDGAHTAPSNARFDDVLRRENPDWGVRDRADVERAAGDRGLTLERTVDMPSNNFTLVYRRR